MLDWLTPATGVEWDGSTLWRRTGERSAHPLHCVRSIGTFRVYVYTRWGGNGFGTQKDYYIVDTQDDSCGYPLYMADYGSIVRRLLNETQA